MAKPFPLVARTATGDTPSHAFPVTIYELPGDLGGGGVLVLGATDPVPEGTPEGTLIARRSA